jgi:hypothetical protein
MKGQFRRLPGGCVATSADAGQHVVYLATRLATMVAATRGRAHAGTIHPVPAQAGVESAA